jgi:hypothetical protein
MSGGGVGNVLSTGASLAAGQSPIGAFGSALGSQLLSGGGGGGSGAAGSAANPYGLGTRNQTQLVGPMAGINPASPAYNIMMQQQQARPQVQPQPQVQNLSPIPAPTQITPPAFYQNYMDEMARINQPALGGGVFSQRPQPLVQQPMGGGISQEDLRALADRARAMGPMPYNTTPDLSRPLVQQPMGGGRLGAPDLSQDAYNRHMATALYRAGTAPTYEQWVQQSSAPKPMPAVFPPKPGVFGPQVQPDRRILPMPPRPVPMPAAQTRPAQGLGLAGLAGMLKGRQ